VKARSWTNTPDRTFTTREQAAAFYACLIWCREWYRRLKDGQAMTTIEDVCREAVERAANARIDVAELPEEGDELDRLDMRDMPDSEVLQRGQASNGELASNRAGDIPAFLRGTEEGFDRLIHRLESGEGEGE
jgi:hypothetical protein